MEYEHRVRNLIKLPSHLQLVTVGFKALSVQCKRPHFLGSAEMGQ